MKKILFKSGTTTIGGVEKVQIEYINFLRKQGYDVKVVIENDWGPGNLLEKEIEVEVIYLKDYEKQEALQNARKMKKKNVYRRWKYYLLEKEIRRFVNKKMEEIYQQFRPDVFIDFDAGLVKRIRTMQDSKNMVWLHSSVKQWKKGKGKLERFVRRLEDYDKIICICKDMEEELTQLNPTLREKTTFLYNPINFEKIRKAAEEPLSSEEEILAKEKFLLMVARFDCVPKDFGTLFQAFDIAKEKGYSGKLYIIGSGPDEDIIKKLLGESKYKEEIFLLGRKENPYPWMKRADKCILSSRYEGFSLFLLEGLILGKEMISSNCQTGPREILNHGRGKLFEIGDKTALSTYLLETTNFYQNFDLKEFEQDIIFQKFLSLLK